MTRKVFVSDFDGTITKKDFFLIYMDRFLGEKGRRFLKDYRAENNPSYQFLNRVFDMHPVTESEYQELLESIEVDNSFEDFLIMLDRFGFDHIILSAGVAFYIEDALKLKRLPEQRVIANSGEWQDGHIRLTHDLQSPIFSEQYGIDKGKAIEQLRKEYDIIYFAGDSIPDIGAAENADLVFAKSSLWRYFQKQEDSRRDKVKEFDSFAEIVEVLRKIEG